MDTFNIYYKRAHVARIEFKTLVDSEFTAHEQRNSVRTVPRYSWTLEFEKTPESFTQVRDFFIAQKGRYKAFYWTWDTAHGGDGTQYRVRFDTDVLEFRIDENHFKTFTIPITQVMSGE